jgi:transcription antitermination protein NusB
MRRQSRELGLQLLYQTEYNAHNTGNISVQNTLDATQEKLDATALHYAELLFNGVLKHKEEIDQKIQSVSRHWKLDRMASVDRNILRLAVFEMIYSPNPTEAKIVINEMIEIARKFGTQDSSSFINGLLDQIIKDERNK